VSPTTTVVHMLRHGEVHNPDRLLYGRLPGFRLSQLGERMADAAAEALAGRDVTHVVASPLERAQQTAAPVAARFGLTVRTDERLIESANVFEGRRFTAGDPAALRDPRSWWILRDPFTPSWGEPYVQIAERMRAALTAAREAAAGHEAVCVSHQLPIWTLRRSVERQRLWHDPRRRRCGLASLTSFHFEDDRITGVSYTEPAAHLVAMSADARTAKGA
jgi:broad specificity phosphatase PhoE